MLAVLRATSGLPEDELPDITVGRAAAGDRDAWRTLVDCYQRRVFALVSRMLAGRDRHVVEDIAQETFLAVFRQLPRYRPDGPARLSTWILTIAARRAIDELRRVRPVPIVDPDLPASGRTDDRLRRMQIMQAIESALAELSPELRAAFLLREYHGLDYGEIARSLQIDLGTVKSRLSRARQALRDRLARLDQGRAS
jgi:RNA polymerase sigma-70 factor, ECF subfamily